MRRSRAVIFQKTILTLAALGVSGVVGASAAELHLLENASGAWTDAANYVENAAPSAGDTILITGGSPSMTKDADFQYSVTVTGGNWTQSGDFYFGNGSVITINAPDSTVKLSGTLRIGGANVSSASGSVLNLIDGNLTSTGWFALGRNEDGTFNQSGGTLKHTSQSVVLGDNPNRSGIINLSGGSFETTQGVLMGSAKNAVGEINVTGGTFTVGGSTLVGNGQNATGKILITGESTSATFQKVSIGAVANSSGSVEIKNGTVKAVGSFIVGAVADAQATLSISGGTVEASTIETQNLGTASISGGKTTASWMNVKNATELSISGGTNTFSELNVVNSALLSISGGTNTFSKLNVSNDSHLSITGGTVKTSSTNVSGNASVSVTGGDWSGYFNLSGESEMTLDGVTATSNGGYVAGNSTLNLINGAKLSMSGTLRVGYFDAKDENGKEIITQGNAAVNIIDGELNITTWIGLGFRQDGATINVFSDGVLRQTRADTLVLGDGRTGTLNLWGGSVLESVNLNTGGVKGTLNFVPTTEDWTFSVDKLTFNQPAAHVSFGNLDGITAFDATTFKIAMPNASGSPNVDANGYWNVGYDTASKTLTAELNQDALEWNTWVDAPQASLDNGESGILNLTGLAGNSFSLFVRGEGDGEALADYFTDSLALFSGLDQENGKFTYDELGMLTYSGLTDLPNYFYWDLSAFNLENGSSLHFGGVPEPSTYLMLLVGLAGIGLLRRKKAVG